VEGVQPCRPNHLPPTAKKNIETIAQLEQQLLLQRSPMERVGEAIARFFGNLA
jgi:hypothetical protein